MTAKLFIALYVGLIVGMFVLFFANPPMAWVFFGFLFVAIFGGMLLMDRPYLIAAGFLLASLIVLGAGLLALLQAWQTNTWPTAPGVITRSWFCTLTTNSSMVYSGSCLEYRYRANDQTFEASLIDTGEFTPLWRSRISGSYRADQEVQVYYNPGNPGISRLAADYTPQDWITTIVGTMMGTLSAFTLFWVLLHRKDAPQAAAPANLTDEQAVHPPRQAKPHRGPRKSTTPDIAGQLERLVELHQKQAITDEEYGLAKKKLLG